MTMFENDRKAKSVSVNKVDGDATSRKHASQSRATGGRGSQPAAAASNPPRSGRDPKSANSLKRSDAFAGNPNSNRSSQHRNSGRISDRKFEMEMVLSPKQLRSRRRGCPSLEALKSLAETYFEVQSKLWPALVGTELLPVRLTDRMASEMAQDAFDRFIEDEPPVFEYAWRIPQDAELGASYNRYSDDNSNPRSLDQQLELTLDRAAQRDIFIPWEYCFFDAGVSGRHPFRHGYQKAIRLLRSEAHSVTALVVDELGRVNRNQLETLVLHEIVEEAGKLLLGASDGFDSSVPNSKMLLSAYAMVHEYESNCKRGRVMRGMKDKWKLGKPLYDPPFGYKLEAVLNPDGSAVVNSKGLPERITAIAPEEADQVRRAFELFVNKAKNVSQIAKLYKSEQVGGRKSWTKKTIKDLLTRTLYIGKERWNYSYKKQNGWEQITKYRKEEEWMWRDMPHLRIIDDAIWEKAQQRIALTTKAYSRDPQDKDVRRSDVKPTRLFRLSCNCCGGYMWLSRGGDRPVVSCLSSKTNGGQCDNVGGRSLATVEDALLNYVLEQFDQEAFLSEIVRSGNSFLADYAKRPAPDLVALQVRYDAAKKGEKKLVDILLKLGDADTGSDDQTEAADDELATRLKQLRVEQQKLKKQIDQAQKGSVIPEPITVDDLRPLIGRLRDLLLQTPEEAAPILYELCGRVYLDQQPVADRKRPQWIAYFQFDLAEIALEITGQSGCPTMGWWEFLRTHSWTLEREETSPVDHIKAEQRIAAICGEMLAAGSSKQQIADALGVDTRTVAEALKLHAAGVKCYVPPRDLSYRRDHEKSKTEKLQSEIVRLHDEEYWSFQRIADHLNTTPALVARAYRQAKPEATKEAALTGKAPPKGRYTKLPRETHDEIQRLLMTTKLSFREIGRQTGSDKWTVRENRDRLIAEGKNVPLRPRENRTK